MFQHTSYQSSDSPPGPQAEAPSPAAQSTLKTFFDRAVAEEKISSPIRPFAESYAAGLLKGAGSQLKNSFYSDDVLIPGQAEAALAQFLSSFSGSKLQQLYTAYDQASSPGANAGLIGEAVQENGEFARSVADDLRRDFATRASRLMLQGNNILSPEDIYSSLIRESALKCSAHKGETAIAAIAGRTPTGEMSAIKERLGDERFDNPTLQKGILELEKLSRKHGPLWNLCKTLYSDLKMGADNITSEEFSQRGFFEGQMCYAVLQHDHHHTNEPLMKMIQGQFPHVKLPDGTREYCRMDGKEHDGLKID